MYRAERALFRVQAAVSRRAPVFLRYLLRAINILRWDGLKTAHPFFYLPL